jgi:hypothetical protein
MNGIKGQGFTETWLIYCFVRYSNVYINSYNIVTMNCFKIQHDPESKSIAKDKSFFFFLNSD